MKKIGLDDFLKAYSVKSFHELPRIRLSDKRFADAKLKHEERIQKQEGKSMNKKLPQINAEAKNIPIVTMDVWKAIKKANKPEPSIFRFGNLLSRIEIDDFGVPFISTLTVESLTYELAHRVYFYKWGGSKKRYKVDATPPRFIVDAILSTPEKPVPVLKRLVTIPVFGPSGSLRLTPGFCKVSGILFSPRESLKIPTVPSHPSQKDIKKAKQILLEDFLVDFPFSTRSDKAHAIVFLLLYPVRALIKGPTPLHVVDAPVQGTGKTLLVSAVESIWVGDEISPMSEATNDEEWRKKLFSALRKAPPYITIDNIKQRLSSAALESILTAEAYEDRILGVSTISKVPIQSIFVATGNNIAYSSEVIRRAVRIRLDAREEEPWLRKTFKHPNLKDWVKQNRPQLLWACYTLVQAWIAARKPRGQDKIGSYEAWAGVMGGILKTCGIDGFLVNIHEFYKEADAEREDRAGFVQAWFKALGCTTVTVTMLLPVAQEFIPDFDNGTARSQQTRLGIFLSKLRGRVFEGLTICKRGSVSGLQTWQLVRKSAQPEKEPQGPEGPFAVAKKIAEEGKRKLKGLKGPLSPSSPGKSGHEA